MAPEERVRNEIARLPTELRELTHQLKATAGAVGAALDSDLVQEPARELLQQALVRLQSAYRTYEATAARIRREQEAAAQESFA